MTGLFIIQAAVAVFALWFGLYLLVGSADKLSLRFAGLALLTYSIGLMVASLSPAGWYPLLTLLPAAFWFAAAYTLLTETLPVTIPVRHLLLPAILLVFGVALVIVSDLSRLVLGALPVMIALTALVWIRRAFREHLPAMPLRVLLVSTLFFALGCVLLVLPVELLAYEWVLLLVGGDLILLGYAVGKLDAYDEGTALLPDALRSLLTTALTTGLIGIQVGLLLDPPDIESRLLFYTILATVVVFNVGQDTFRKLLDRTVFGRDSTLANERQTLAAVSSALPRRDDSLQPLALGEDELVRLTRRALSHYNNPGKLASSPLIRLPTITRRLRAEDRIDDSLARTHELRRLLAECILRLKPYSDRDFDTGDDWRYYNVLYFPYVVGVKPYALRPAGDALEPPAQAALAWFREQVPERTLYNWQNEAARLIALQLRESGEVIDAP